LDRLLAVSRIQLLPITWRRIVLICMILGAKVWEELAVWNAGKKKKQTIRIY